MKTMKTTKAKPRAQAQRGGGGGVAETSERLRKSANNALPSRSNDDDNDAEVLDDREREIMQRVAEGKSNDEIAKEVYVSVDTVKFYLKQIFAKFGFKNRTEAAVAWERGLRESSSDHPELT